MPRAREASERAVALDPDNTEALSTLADVAIQYDRDATRAAALWARVLEIDPRNVRGLCEGALWQVGVGRITPGQAVERTARAVDADPLNSWAIGMHAYMLGFSGRHVEATAAGARAVDADPASFFARYAQAQAHAWAGDHVGSLSLAGSLLATSGRHVWVLSLLGWLHGKLGHAEAADAVHEELRGRSRHEYIGPFWLAVTAAAAGHRDEAIVALKRGIDEHDPIAAVTPVLVHLDQVRELPGFAGLVEGSWR